MNLTHWITELASILLPTQLVHPRVVLEYYNMFFFFFFEMRPHQGLSILVCIILEYILHSWFHRWLALWLWAGFLTSLGRISLDDRMIRAPVIPAFRYMKVFCKVSVYWCQGGLVPRALTLYPGLYLGGLPWISFYSCVWWGDNGQGCIYCCRRSSGGDAHSLGLQRANRLSEHRKPLPAHPPPPWELLVLFPLGPFYTFTGSCSSAGLPGYPSILPIREPMAHASNLVSLKLHTCFMELVLSRCCTLIILWEGGLMCFPLRCSQSGVSGVGRWGKEAKESVEGWRSSCSSGAELRDLNSTCLELPEANWHCVSIVTVLAGWGYC